MLTNAESLFNHSTLPQIHALWLSDFSSAGYLVPAGTERGKWMDGRMDGREAELDPLGSDRTHPSFHCRLSVLSHTLGPADVDPDPPNYLHASVMEVELGHIVRCCSFLGFKLFPDAG